MRKKFNFFSFLAKRRNNYTIYLVVYKVFGLSEYLRNIDNYLEVLFN